MLFLFPWKFSVHYVPYSVQKKSFYSLSRLEKGKFNCNISLKITYHFNFLYYAADKSVSPCKEGEFQCGGSNQCIPESKVCHAHKDCTNGEDTPPPPPHSLNFSFASFIYQMQKCIPRAGLLVSDVTDMRNTLFSPVWIAFTSTRNQIYASDTSRNPLQSYQVFHSILDLLLKISFLSKLLLILLHYFITFG